MAEAIVNHDRSDEWQANSAGTLPTGFVNPVALQVLHEIGIEHQGRSKSIQEFNGQTFDHVITVCGDAEANCPIWLGHGRKVHIGFRDPAKFTGTDEETLQEFREVRDQIRKEIIDYLISVEE
jgi:arsenate reductase